jgi:hypothetical protein
MPITEERISTIKQTTRIVRPILVVLGLFLVKTNQISQIQFFIILASVLLVGLILETYITIQTNPDVTIMSHVKKVVFRIVPFLIVPAIIYALYKYDLLTGITDILFPNNSTDTPK